MRQKIAIAVGMLFGVATLFLIGHSSRSTRVALSFSGYSTNGSDVLFALTNHTRFYLSYSHPRIQVHTPAGWTNYYGIEFLMCRLIGGPLPAHNGTTLWATLPSGSLRWRASVQYRLEPAYELGWRA